MNFSEYQSEALKTVIYPRGPYYPLLALGEEVGEVQGLFAKCHRDNKHIDYDALKKELGDVLWNLSALCFEMGFNLEEIALGNLHKLADRAKRGVINGSGDNR